MIAKLNHINFIFHVQLTFLNFFIFSCEDYKAILANLALDALLVIYHLVSHKNEKPSYMYMLLCEYFTLQAL